jgi:hypothetical protein
MCTGWIEGGEIMTYETLNLTWRGIDFTLGYNAHFSPAANIAHIEIHCDDPLPLTETGYKSIFITASDIADIKIAAALIRQELDRIADKTGWQQERQLSLF